MVNRIPPLRVEVGWGGPVASVIVRDPVRSARRVSEVTGLTGD